MARSRYVITEPNRPHFLTCTVVEWLPVFTRPQAVQILLDSWSWLRSHEGLRLYGYVVLENHLHFIAQAERLDQCVSRFKSFTARRIIDHLQERNSKHLLDRLHFVRRLHKGRSGLSALAGRNPCGVDIQRGDDAREVGVHPRQSGETGLRRAAGTLALFQRRALCGAGRGD